MADVSMTVGTDVAEMDFTPAFTAAEARQIEAVNDSTGKARRLALELLTMSRDDLIKVIKSDPEAATGMVDVLTFGMERNQIIQEQLQAGFARLCAADAHLG